MECKLNPVEVNDALKIFYKEHQGNIKFILDGKEVTPCAFSPCIVDGEYTIGDYGELLNLSITGRCNCKLDKLDNKNYYFNCVVQILAVGPDIRESGESKTGSVIISDSLAVVVSELKNNEIYLKVRQ